jgi:Xaa-Pro aminopeptidase
MSRLENLRTRLRDRELEGVLISNRENRRYLSYFTGSSGVLVIGIEETFLVTDFRYWEQAASESKGFEIYKQGPQLWASIGELLQKLKWERIGFEAGTLTFEEFQKLKDVVGLNVSLTPVTDFVEELRRIKEDGEMELIARAAAITDIAWEKTINRIGPGVKERDLALEFDYQLRLNGAEGSAFPTIVAFGPRAALPHAAPGGKEIRSGDFVLIDGGALYQGYCADMTRTVVFGKSDPEQERIYELVLKAQLEALEYMKAGLIGKEIDAKARQVISGAGYGDKFGHGLGHSVGLNIHENPRLSPNETGSIPMGAVITVEPGIYLPDWGGVRIEDLVVVDENGVRNLTGSPKDKLLEM